MSDDFQLQVNSLTNRLELIDRANPKQKPFYIDFCSGKNSYRLRQVSRQDPLARAVGVKKDFIPTVVDTTAGMGRDALILAHCGCQVTLLERNPTMYQLLRDAIAHLDDEVISQQLQLYFMSAKAYLQQLDIKPDVIYIDPMYPEGNKTALVKQEMRIIRQVVGDDLDAGDWFDLALTQAKKRVVVKRHRLAPSLQNQTPSHVIEGKTIRFDVYMC